MSARLPPLIAVCLPTWTGSAAGQVHAELVVRNARVITMDSSQRRAEGFAVWRGRFLVVGDEDDVAPVIGPATRVIDARGLVVTPGFIDAHSHPGPTFAFESPHAVVELGPGAVATMDELIGALRAKTAITPPGQWVRGRGYEDTKLGRHPTREDLDRATSEHPVWIRHSSGHLSAVNSYVIAAAGVDRDTPDPPGGALDRDRDGIPNGVCRERGCGLLRSETLPSFPTPSPEELVEGLLRTFRAFVAEGITSLVDARGSPRKLMLYRAARDAGQPVRISMMVSRDYLPELVAAGVWTGLGDERLRIGTIKTSHGNSLSGRTAWLYEPYEMINPETGRQDYYGIPPAKSQAALDSLIHAIRAAGFQAAVHSNGDREIDMLLDAFAKALARLPRPDHRHRIEHASVVNPRILDRVKALGLVLALHSYVWEHGDKMEAYGERRWPLMHANRSALDMGIVVAGNSDYPVSAADPLLRIQSLVTRRSAQGKVYGAEQRLTPEQAIRTWTVGGAWATFEEDLKGSITAGKLADFVVLSADPMTAEPLAIKDIAVVMTVIGGAVVYDASRAAPFTF